MEKEYNKLNESEKILRAMFTPSSEEGKELSRGDEILMRFSEVMEELVDSPILMEGYDIIGDDRAHLEEKYRRDGREQNTKEIIKNMLDDNLSIPTIAKYVNLEAEEVEKIVSSLKKGESKN